MTTRRALIASLVLAVPALAPLALLPAPAHAQPYPNRVIKMIVPFPPGGPIDTMGRLVAHEIASRLRQEVVIENRPGAGSTLGTKSVAAAEPDGR